MDSLKSSRAAADHDRDRALTAVATLSGKSGLPEDAGEEVVPDVALVRVGDSKGDLTAHPELAAAT
jgi:hypothetical protein